MAHFFFINLNTFFKFALNDYDHILFINFDNYFTLKYTLGTHSLDGSGYFVVI